jgi:hypothetical protein
MTAATPAHPHPKLQWWREILIAVGFYLVYQQVRNKFGAGPESRDIAFRHGRGVIKVERYLGAWFEPRLQHWYLGLPGHGLIRWWNIFYGTAHFFVTIGVLVVVFLKAPQWYRLLRTTLAATTAIALCGFAGYTLMPPRLLGATSKFGACKGGPYDCHHYGIVDTIDRYGGIWKFGQGKAAIISNQYAAMPSMHCGWSTWCAVAVVVVVGHGRLRWLAFLYPSATLFCILVTGNHYWIDAVGGLVTLALGAGIAVLIERFTDRWRARRAERATDSSEPADTVPA